MTLQLDFDAKDTLNRLDLVKKDMNKIARRMMAKVFQAIRRDTRNTKLKGQVLQKRSGNLMKSIVYKTKPDFTGYIVARQIYAGMHEFGGKILPNGKYRMNEKYKGYLSFKLEDGTFRHIKELTMPRRPFLGDVFYSYFTTNKAEILMEQILDIALKELFNDK